MWNFKNFPARIERLPEKGIGPPHCVDVFGYFNKQLVVYREFRFFVKEGTFKVEMLPISEFEEKFKKYILVEEKE
jgi:hypothetical protein